MCPATHPFPLSDGVLCCSVGISANEPYDAIAHTDPPHVCEEEHIKLCPNITRDGVCKDQGNIG